MMLNKENIEIIYPGIMVFRNGIKEPEKMIETLSAYNNWEKWYDVGEQVLFNPMSYHYFHSFPSREEWDKSRSDELEDKQKISASPTELKELADQYETLFFEATQYYIDHYGYTLDNWMHGGSNILRYEGKKATTEDIANTGGVTEEVDKYDSTKGKAGSTQEMTLPFHTDFYQADALEPGLKAEYTVTMYLNDNYEGGEIDFRIFNGPDKEMRIEGYSLKPLDPHHGEVPEIMYRPQPGDIIIFPSRPPYYHGVRRVESGMKYFVRMFWMSVLE